MPDRFPHVYEVETPEGAEGWRDMYSYYLIPQEETRAHEEKMFWLQDAYHHAHAYYPFDTIGFEGWAVGCGQNTSRIFAVPPVLGLDQRLVNGYLYLTPVPITDPDIVEERVAHFHERAKFYYENWDELYERWKVKAEKLIHEMEAVEIPDTLPEIEPVEVVLEGRGRSTGYNVLESYHTLVDQFLLMHQYHFEMVNIGYGAYVTFFEFCKSTFPDIADQDVARMVAGIDVMLYRPDQELKNLARAAIELGIEDIFRGNRESEEVTADLSGSEAGRDWLGRMEKISYPWFYFSTEYGFYHDQIAWIDDLSVPFRGIGNYIEALERGDDIERPTERLKTERDELAEQYRSFLSDDAVQAQFDGLLALSQQVFPHIEEHNFYVEQWCHTVFWNKIREIGQLCVSRGMIDDSEDIFYLNRFEVDEALFDQVSAWAIGVPPRGAKRNREKIAKRKKILQALREWHAPPALGTPPEVVNDPLSIVNYGVSTERVQEWLAGVDLDNAQKLSGVPAGQGVAEGLARIIRSEKDLPSVEPGEILVAPITAPSWAAIFSKVSAVVTDAGGMMSHAAIVSREYGIPAVVAVGHATAALKTGQRLRVDGKAGTIVVLEDVPDGDRVASADSAG